MTSVKVVSRIRPSNSFEQSLGFEEIVSPLNENTVHINTNDYTGNFVYDRVFGADSTQEDLFSYSIKPTVDDLFQGYNGTVLAYGQTGSGKTYTMMGVEGDPENSGLTPRMLHRIFDKIRSSPSTTEYEVKVSYMEIYMEKIRDLLSPDNDHLTVHENKLQGVYVEGLKTVYVSSEAEAFQILNQGMNSRAVASTNMNATSSRSHSIFVVEVVQTNNSSGETRRGRLFLVDLAGSESVGKSGAVGQTLEEAKKINRSLSTLGMVINSLTENKHGHIPYRDSKLTRILKESLGGNSRTTLIINCSPSIYNASETLSTLRFGNRAKNIKNKVVVNSELSMDEMKRKLHFYKELLSHCDCNLFEKLKLSSKQDPSNLFLEGEENHSMHDHTFVNHSLASTSIDKFRDMDFGMDNTSTRVGSQLLDTSKAEAVEQLYARAQTELKDRDGLLSSTRQQLSYLMDALGDAHKRYVELVQNHRRKEDMGATSQTSSTVETPSSVVKHDEDQVNQERELLLQKLSAMDTSLTSLVYVQQRLLQAVSANKRPGSGTVVKKIQGGH
ncbi:kinesin-like protein Klp3 [Schizosaccharomyces octosporus yFS286]|uniref:Kinesin-like protein n=1 Tax=Schizosaccharomyces octosporus (strain yFS286) TaxID=483514 RepID=S9RGN6_SCHOY|nr:kinesin-like protein Klp3 [Schizosaccharomyces octosporus yFS286]EPX73214.1 kinesin-like protein Klp3 [Schizosaccharomyces octosporus yFS286]